MRIWQALLVLAVSPAALQAQQIRARVVDADQRSPLAAVHVVVTDSAGTEHAAARTDTNGFFTIERLAAGSYTLVLERDGYDVVRQPLRIQEPRSITLPAILMQSRAMALDPVRAEAERRQPAIHASEGVRPEYVLAGSRMAELEKVNASAAAVYRELGLRVRENVTPAGRSFCVQANRGPTSMRGGGPGCDPVAVIVDGVVIQDGVQVLRSFKVYAWESVEYLTATEASLQYGLLASSSGGAIVLWSRGSGPYRSAARDGGSR